MQSAVYITMVTTAYVCSVLYRDLLRLHNAPDVEHKLECFPAVFESCVTTGCDSDC